MADSSTRAMAEPLSPRLVMRNAAGVAGGPICAGVTDTPVSGCSVGLEATM